MLVVTRRTEPDVVASDDYGVFDRQGHELGSVADVSQGFLHRAARLLPKYDQYVTRRFEVRDANHSTVLRMTRPAKDPRTRFVVSRSDETPIGEIVPHGDNRFTLIAEEQTIAAVHTPSRPGWDAVISDRAGTEIARIGRRAAEVSPIGGDTYVVEIPKQLPEPLASMVLATALTIETALTR
ncbi:hypothetical protein GCM10022222_70630 [Amycolatopsis ultiminotia]|uniref:Scramblase n=1 Tax=Amycolatopsis ultiminotia TaxID=543629 RepID=A0ABP6Y1D3_9PSEU